MLEYLFIMQTRERANISYKVCFPESCNLWDYLSERKNSLRAKYVGEGDCKDIP